MGTCLFPFLCLVVAMVVTSVLALCPSTPPSCLHDFYRISTNYRRATLGNDRSQALLSLTKTTDAGLTRARFLASLVSGAGVAAMFPLNPAAAFDGGVGGLGKTKPETGVRFAPGASPMETSAGMDFSKAGNDIFNEVLAPDGTPALVAFKSPWPLLSGSSGIAARDLREPESAFVVVGKVPKGKGELGMDFWLESVFGSEGKFGAYGAPFDIGIKKIADSNNKGTALYSASFTTLTPAMRESERKAYISTSVVGDGVFMLVTGTTAARFKNQEATLRRVANSFEVVELAQSKRRVGGSGENG